MLCVHNLHLYTCISAHRHAISGLLPWYIGPAAGSHGRIDTGWSYDNDAILTASMKDLTQHYNRVFRLSRDVKYSLIISLKGRIRFSETETGFSLVSTVLCTLLCETKTGFRNHRNHPRTWFRCWNDATPTCLLVRASRWKLTNRKKNALYTV